MNTVGQTHSDTHIFEICEASKVLRRILKVMTAVSDVQYCQRELFEKSACLLRVACIIGAHRTKVFNTNTLHDLPVEQVSLSVSSTAQIPLNTTDREQKVLDVLCGVALP